ncbi:MAG TPA: thiamine phosphate synthase [Pyrinomonadaceae bacterium]|nr:thiamine phosphate synthase [Pyrinomonadaceae bacterium]
MHSRLELPRVYPVTDRKLSGLSHAEQVRRLAAAGATLIQLREKHLPADEFYEEAVKAVSAAREAGVVLLINDRVDIAKMTGADGVHLGQDDLPPAAARELLGPDAIIGFSTHSLAEAIAAASEPVDYIAFGPIFPTDTKSDTEPVVGLERFAEIRNTLPKMQLVAIGGINADNIAAVIEAGADSAAVISSAVAEGENIAKNLALLNAAAMVNRSSGAK